MSEEQLALYKPVEYRDEVITATRVYFSWLDRLRILWHGRCEVHVNTRTEN